MATVLRDDVVSDIPASEVVPGDIVKLRAGSLIPADALLLDARDFFVSQSLLTGEPTANSSCPVYRHSTTSKAARSTM